MIISRTPYRISFFGGGTDYPEWYLRNGGEVLATTIDKYIYITCRYLPPFFEHRLRVVYSKIEVGHSPDDIRHPSAREVLKYMGIKNGVEIHYDGDLPARSGIGSSSSFTVGLLNTLYAYQGKMVPKHQLAMESIHIEQKLIKEVVGSQDQVSAAHGGFNHIQFLENGTIKIHPITLEQEKINRLDANLMLFYTGILRNAEDVAKSYVMNIVTKEKHLIRIREMVHEAIAILNNSDDLTNFGKLLHEGWLAKRGLSNLVSNYRVDEIYSAARAAGAIGGKLSGAGGGGFLLLFVPPEKQASVKEKLNKLIHVPFSLEFNGSQIIFHQAHSKFREEEIKLDNNEITKFVELIQK